MFVGVAAVVYENIDLAELREQPRQQYLESPSKSIQFARRSSGTIHPVNFPGGGYSPLSMSMEQTLPVSLRRQAVSR